MTYTAAGALSTICSGTNGCSTTQETRQYNSRLQPSLMELGTSTNPTADYSLAYSYVAGGTSSCTDPQGTGDNGDIMGETLTDNYNSGYDHTTVNCYDGVNRLTQSIATGNSSYNMTYSYDQYGNMTCAPGSGGLPCTQMTYNGATNHLTDIGGTAVTYDAAGNLTNDGATSYQYDAEGRVVLATNLSTGSTDSSVYDALGHRVSETVPDGANYTRTFLYPRDLEGHWTGLFDIRPSQNWAGWDVDSMAQAGIVLQHCCGYVYLQHFNALGSTLMTTDQTGAVRWQQLYYPWGQVWEQYGDEFWARYAGMDFPGLQGNYVTPHRNYNPTVGRWLVPDPGGRKVVNLANPQTWNMYAYVANNPTTLNDPSGLNACGTNEDDTCSAEIKFTSRTKDKNGNYNDQYAHVKGSGQYNATATVTVRDHGKVITTRKFLASTVPSGPGLATVRNGTYSGTLGYHDGHPAILLNGGGSVPVVGGFDPATGKNYATGIFVHIAGWMEHRAPLGLTGMRHNGQPVSRGCQLICTQQYGSFENVTGLNASPPQQDFTVILDTSENQ